MRRMWDIKVLGLIVLILAGASIIAATNFDIMPKFKPAGNDILVRIHVLADHPPPGSKYELRGGEPKTVGIYKFYLKEPGVPGSGAFKKLDSISLDKLNEMEFYGEKSVKRIDGTLCVGYPSTNFIDGKACIEIDQSQEEVEVTVHYWETSLMIL